MPLLSRNKMAGKGGGILFLSHCRCVEVGTPGLIGWFHDVHTGSGISCVSVPPSLTHASIYKVFLLDDHCGFSHPSHVPDRKGIQGKGQSLLLAE